MKRRSAKNPQKDILDTATRMGELLLESGAEIERVEESMERVCHYYGAEGESFYVLSNGIFLTAEDAAGNCYARAEHIPLAATRMDRIEALNELSREIEQGRHTPEQAEEVLERIAVLPGKSQFHQILASGVGAAAFCYLPGRGIADTVTAFLAGILLQLFLWKAGACLSKATGIIAGSTLVTTICCLSFLGTFGADLNSMIIGAIMPLIPGVGFVVSIRDIVNGDYLSGFIRLLDALLVFFCIALGTGLVLSVFEIFTGGTLL
ncbi:MAG: threonine/serine exporter family protein [Stomatobaculum sp.]|nr:threonine/serine exporter family protein [Stomatobaculum sp.]